MNALVSIFRAKDFKERESNVKTAIINARKSRQHVDNKIEDMYAELNGCGDQWFLVPKKPIDSCDED